VISNKLGFDTGHRPGALARYFAKRWLKERSAKGERLIARLLEAALGRNAMYFIEKTKEYVDKWGGSAKVVPVDAFDGFVITGDPVEDTIIPHAVLAWTCMNDRPWQEEVYHRWLDSLLAAGSAEAAYLAASLWPAHDLMEKVTYRPVGWRVYRGRLDAEAERLILMEMLKGDDAPRIPLYGSFEYDDVLSPEKLPEQYIKKHGFTHPICGLVGPRAFKWDGDLHNRIQTALAAPSWSDGMKGAAMLLYLSLNAFNNLSKKQELDAIDSQIILNSTLEAFRELSVPLQEIIKTLGQNLFKLDERHIKIINFHMNKMKNIDYNLIKDYINYLIILYNKTLNESDLSMNIFRKYMSIGLKTNDILYIGRDIKNIIFNLMLKEKEKVKSWLEKQVDDLRIKDILLATYITKRIDYTDLYIITIKDELKTERVYKKIEDIYGKMKYIDKIILFIDQARKYFTPDWDQYKICDFIDGILKKEEGINFNCNFREDYAKIIYIWNPNRIHILGKNMFLESNHIGLYLYCEILNEWERIAVDFTDRIKGEKELKLYSYTRNKIIENLYRHSIDNIEINLNLCLNKIEYNNLPYKGIKRKLIMKLMNIIENNYDKISEYFKDESKLTKARKVILSNIYFLGDKFRNSRSIGLLGIDNKSQNMIIY